MKTTLSMATVAILGANALRIKSEIWKGDEDSSIIGGATKTTVGGAKKVGQEGTAVIGGAT